MERCFVHIAGSAWETRIPMVDISQAELLVKKILAFKTAGSLEPLVVTDGDQRSVGFIIPSNVQMVMFHTQSDTSEKLSFEVLQMQHRYYSKLLEQ